ALVAIALAAVRLPRSELRPTFAAGAAMQEVADFGVWRAAQVGVRPLALLGLRATVAAVAGTHALGRLEAARLLVAPAMTVINGTGSALLPLYRQRLDDGVDLRSLLRRS